MKKGMVFNMNKERRDGLFMDNSILITDIKKSGFSIQTRLFQCLAILIGSWSSLSILLESIPIPAKVSAIYLTIVLCAAVVFILCLVPSYNAVKLFFGVLFYSLFIISRFPALRNGFYITENVVIDRLEQYYDVRINSYIADYESGIADSTLLMIMIAIPVVTMLSIAIVRGRFINITSIILFLPIAVSFLIGLTPSEKYLIAYIAAVLYLTRSGFSGKHLANKRQKVIMHRINSWAGVWLSMISLLLFFILKLVIPQESYDGLTQIKDMKKDIQSKILSINLNDITATVTNFKLPAFTSSKGGLDGGALGRTGKVEYSGSEQLRITTDYHTVKNGVYLKGYVGSYYTGDRWMGYSDNEAAEYREFINSLSNNNFYPINQTVDLINAGRHVGSIKVNEFSHMKVEYIDANKRFIYSPYFTDYGIMSNINYKQDLYPTPRKQTSSYSFEYYNLISLTDYDVLMNQLGYIYDSILNEQVDYIEYEKLYRRFVERAYTQLPEDGLDRLKKQCEDALRQELFRTVDDKILYIKDYLSSNTSYTLSPGKVPAGKDYVEYFLYDNKRGYCSHYASAAVLMLRALGVPARYVEGYTVSPSDIAINTMGEVAFLLNENGFYNDVEISVKDYNAHAWVEVYQNGAGWIPVEFTPAAGIGYNAYSREELNAPTVTVPPAKDLSPTPVVGKTQDEIQKPDITTPVDNAENKTSNEDQPKTDSIRLIVLLLFSVSLILIALLILKRNIQVRKVSCNNKAIYFFARVERIVNFVRGSSYKKRIQLEEDPNYLKYSYDFIDIDAFDTFMNTVRKARYGKGHISIKELQQVEKFHDNFLMKLYSGLPFIKKAFLKIILFID